MAKRKQRLAPVPPPKKLTRRATATRAPAEERPRALQLVDDGARRRAEEDASEQPDAAQQIVVGIGASAGGLEAVKELVEHLNPTGGLAYVLVQHLAPQHESFLAELLNSTSQIPVVQAEERMPLMSDRLHVIPPNVHMTIADGRLHMAPRPLGSHQVQPDRFVFREPRSPCSGLLGRRRAVGHRVGRCRRPPRDQGRGRVNHRAGSRHREVRRHAAGGDRDRCRRSRFCRPARLPPSSCASARIPSCRPAALSLVFQRCPLQKRS